MTVAGIVAWLLCVAILSNVNEPACAVFLVASLWIWKTER